MMFQSFPFAQSSGLPVPYRTSISPSLSDGTQIQIIGTPTGNRFEINLKNSQDDAIFHFNPRLDERIVVLNSSQRGSWGQEDRHPSPFHQGSRFAVVITATHRGFTVTVDNRRICDFHHRLPMHFGQLVEVNGDIRLDSVNVQPPAMSSMNFPQMTVHTSSISNFIGGLSASFGIPAAASVIQSAFTMGGVPGVVPSIQSCRIGTGSRIFVRGFIPLGAQRFELNLLQGHSDSSDIAFHFNPRFDTRTIVKNHRQNGQWGNEENQPFPSSMLFAPGSPLDLQIICDPYKYVVLSNNMLLAEYYHKLPPGSVMAVQYKGDVQVTSTGQM